MENKDYERLKEIEFILLQNGLNGKFLSQSEYQSLTLEKARIMQQS